MNDEFVNLGKKISLSIEEIMEKSFNAGLERAAEIAEDTDSCKWDDPTATHIAAAIRKELEK